MHGLSSGHSSQSPPLESSSQSLYRFGVLGAALYALRFHYSHFPYELSCAWYWPCTKGSLAITTMISPLLSTLKGIKLKGDKFLPLRLAKVAYNV
ncbi:hypothetical protein VNO77_25369 [Canavalia gladiata]|uniref:Uncharacterized protein n=1 Tax=Canavalia gladiata TaxID=3824 RepID=A0AAN9L7Z7_CANGL